MAHKNRKSDSAFKAEMLLIAPHLQCLTEYLGAKVKVTVRDINCNHEWQITPSNATHKKHGLVCPECNSTSRRKTKDSFNNELGPNLHIEEYKGARIPTKITSSICGHCWDITPSNFSTHGIGDICPICNPNRFGATQKEIVEFIKQYYNGWIIENDRDILEGKELDIVLPDLGLAIEYNGIYWHSEEKVGRDYHLWKTNMVSDFEYKLIHIMEDEWLYKKDIIESRLRALLSMSIKIPARKCKIIRLGYTETKKFLDANHLRGAGAPSRYNLGLVFEGLLVAVQTFGIPKTSTDCEYELVRYCNLLNTTVIGGASKLLNAFIKSQEPKGIISYSDSRWGDGNMYKQLGFKFSHTTPPGYTYYLRTKPESRYNFQKHKLKDRFPLIYKDSLTEAEIMKLAGYVRVYDCGNKVWVLK